MQAVVSLLETSAYSRIEALWRVLELRCGLEGIKATPYPHFSWHVAEEYSGIDLDQRLHNLAFPMKPFMVRTAGLGLFTGSEPVIYVLITKDEKLLRFHKKIWQAVESQSNEPNPYYTPSKWVPHVTLAYGDVNKQKLLCAIEELAFLPFNWEIKIDNLALVGQAGEEIGSLKSRYNFERR